MMKNWVDPEAKAEAERYDNPIPSRPLMSETARKNNAPSHGDLVAHWEPADQRSSAARSRRLMAMVRHGQWMKDGYKCQIAREQPESAATGYSHSRGMGTAH